MKLKNIYVKWIASVCISFVILNAICMIYNKYPGWIDRTGASTDSIWHPNSLLIHNSEGMGIYKVDENGYLNNGSLIESGYILAVGSSHTQGKEVWEGYRYSDVLNSLVKQHSGIYEDKDLVVYNVSQDGLEFCNMINSFICLTDEFPNSRCIILELSYTDYLPAEMEKAMVQQEFIIENTGTKIMNHLSFAEKIKMCIKECFPLFSRIKSQYEAALGEDDTRELIDIDTYAEVTGRALDLIKTEYDGQIIIFYKPSVNLTDEGMTVNKEMTTDTFRDLCAEKGICFIDMGNRFLEAYKDEYLVPYGFCNTSIAAGHLNKDGHRLIAEELYEYIGRIDENR